MIEYLEDETLAEQLKIGPLPLDQVLRYAIEIADALDKADLGLAKLKQEATSVAPLSQRPTADSAMTAEGTILGTLQYMAPEQVEGKKRDRCTDQYLRLRRSSVRGGHGEEGI